MDERTITEWVDREQGPECFCGWPTFVVMMDGQPQLICFGHTKEEGAAFPLPRTRPVNWPNLTHEEMKLLVEEGVREQNLTP